MKRILLLFFCMLCFGYYYGQSIKNSPSNNYSRWPYVGESIPPYLAITGGIETIKSHYYLIGLSYSMSDIFSTAYEGFGGVKMYYKQDMFNPKNNGLEADLCIAGGLTFGLNYNLNHVNNNNIHGFKPFIGISIFHTRFYYGYCFYKSSLDTGHDLVHNRFTLSMDIPIIKTKR